MTDLQELTGQESGIVIYHETDEAIICNWSHVEGLPRLFGFGAVIGLKDEFEAVKGIHSDNLPAYIDGISVIYSNDEDVPQTGRVYHLEDRNATVLAPAGWN